LDERAQVVGRFVADIEVEAAASAVAAQMA
jgi:hypothetical protein